MPLPLSLKYRFLTKQRDPIWPTCLMVRSVTTMLWQTFSLHRESSQRRKPIAVTKKNLETLELDAAMSGPVFGRAVVLNNRGCLTWDSTILVDSLHRHHLILQLASKVDNSIQATIERKPIRERQPHQLCTKR